MQAPGSQSPTRPAYPAADSDTPFPVPIIPSLGYRPAQQPQLNGDQTQYSHQLSHEPVGTRGVDTEAHIPGLNYTTNEKYYADQEKAKNTGENHDLLTSRVQFAAYGAKDGKDTGRSTGPPPSSPGLRNSNFKAWTPTSLETWFWVPLVVFLVGASIGLEVALHISNKNKGWNAGPDNDSSPGAIARHYAYTLPPVIISSIVVALWAWTVADIKKLQPYVDLVHGDSPANKSLLLDYTRDNAFLVWLRAYSNRHYLVALGSLMVILTLCFQPLAAAILVEKDTWFTDPEITRSNLAALSLNQNQEFNDLTSFLSGAGFAGAAVMYNLEPPPFVRVPYTVAPFQLPVDLISNGTAFANTAAVKTDTGCVDAPVQMTQSGPGQWTNSASSNGCSFTWPVSNSNGTILFGSSPPDTCTNAQPPQFSPVVFWFFSYVPTPVASATFCSPQISFWDVNVGADISSGNITTITELRPFSATANPPSNFSSLSGNITGAPLSGRAYNGISFDLQSPDQFILARQAAIRLQLPASMFQAARQTAQGYAGTFGTGAFTNIVSSVYATYLALVARDVYFLPVNEPIGLINRTFRKRVWLSDAAVHLLAVAMLILAIFAIILHLFHHTDRRDLRLMHEPGTIASAMSIGAQTGVANVLAGRQGENDLKEALANKTFRMDPERNVLVMSGEEGYDDPIAPASSGTRASRRQSVLNNLQYRRRSRRFTVTDHSAPLSPSMYASNDPQSPHTPNSPKDPRSLPQTSTHNSSHVLPPV